VARKHTSRKSSQSGLSKPLLLVSVAAVLLGLGLLIFRYQPSPTIEAPSGIALGKLPAGVSSGDLSLLVITLDTTRADRIGIYGYPEIDTPNLDRLGREGVVFEQAESVAPLTLPARGRLPGGSPGMSCPVVP
jgi:hypothetical protein